jgi:hypothetical protein
MCPSSIQSTLEFLPSVPASILLSAGFSLMGFFALCRIRLGSSKDGGHDELVRLPECHPCARFFICFLLNTNIFPVRGLGRKRAMHSGSSRCYISAMSDACLGSAMAVPRQQRPIASLRLDLLPVRGTTRSCTRALQDTLLISETCTASCTNKTVRTKQLSRGTLHEGSLKKRLGIRSTRLE